MRGESRDSSTFTQIGTQVNRPPPLPERAFRPWAEEEAEKMQAVIAEGVALGGLQEIVLTAEEAAAKRLADFVSATPIDKMIADAQDSGIPLLDRPGGLIGMLTARVIEQALGAEMDDHLGYVKGDPPGNGSGIPGTAPSGRRSPRRPGRCGSRCRGTGSRHSSRRPW